MCAFAFFVRAFGIVQIPCRANLAPSRCRPATSWRAVRSGLKKLDMPPYGPPLFRAARMTLRVPCRPYSGLERLLAGSGHPSAGDRSRTAGLRNQLGSLDRLQGLVGSAGGPALCQYAETTSPTSRFMSFIALPAGPGLATSREEAANLGYRAVPLTGVWGNEGLHKSSTRSARTRRWLRASRLPDPPFELRGKHLLRRHACLIRVTRPYGPMVYLAAASSRHRRCGTGL